MPGLMMHLTCAQYFAPDAALPFYLGSIAPDAVCGREAKDRSHFRDRNDRPAALRALARSAEWAGDFHRGALLHLYTDYLWDEGALHDFAQRHGADWFLPYRAELSRASVALYRRNPQGAALFQRLADCPETDFCPLPDITTAETAAFVRRNGLWYAEQAKTLAPAEEFTPALVDDFLQDTAKKFAAFLAE